MHGCFRGCSYLLLVKFVHRDLAVFLTAGFDFDCYPQPGSIYSTDAIVSCAAVLGTGHAAALSDVRTTVLWPY